ncbi:MAG: translocation protein TolB precursor, partial [Kingella sp. (in: b-proteobacteria)]
MSTPRDKSEIVSDTAKSYLYQLMKQKRFGYTKALDNKEINKGIELEDIAIKNSGLIRGKVYKKCDLPRQVQRFDNPYCEARLTGECDILDGDLIIDTKCSWHFDSFPICFAEAEQKAGKQGYIWQMHGYMRLYNAKTANIDFWLLPTPEHFFSDWQRENDPELVYQHTDLIESIPLNQ